MRDVSDSLRIRRDGELTMTQLVARVQGPRSLFKNRLRWGLAVGIDRADSHLHARRAIEVQGRLAEIGHHRVAIPDLLIAAAAEAAEVPVLHYDSDYDLIASATGREVAWVVEPGSID